MTDADHHEGLDGGPAVDSTTAMPASRPPPCRRRRGLLLVGRARHHAPKPRLNRRSGASPASVAEPPPRAHHAAIMLCGRARQRQLLDDTPIIIYLVYLIHMLPLFAAAAANATGAPGVAATAVIGTVATCAAAFAGCAAGGRGFSSALSMEELWADARALGATDAHFTEAATSRSPRQAVTELRRHLCRDYRVLRAMVLRHQGADESWLPHVSTSDEMNKPDVITLLMRLGNFHAASGGPGAAAAGGWCGDSGSRGAAGESPEEEPRRAAAKHRQRRRALAVVRAACLLLRLVAFVHLLPFAAASASDTSSAGASGASIAAGAGAVVAAGAAAAAAYAAAGPGAAASAGPAAEPEAAANAGAPTSDDSSSSGDEYTDAFDDGQQPQPPAASPRDGEPAAESEPAAEPRGVVSASPVERAISLRWLVDFAARNRGTRFSFERKEFLAPGDGGAMATRAASTSRSTRSPRTAPRGGRPSRRAPASQSWCGTPTSCSRS